MTVRFHPHARARLVERGASEAEVIATVEQGESFPAKFGRMDSGVTFRTMLSGEAGIMRQSRLRQSQCAKVRAGL